MPKRFFEIFRAGNYPQGSFDAEDIAAIAENYDPSFLEAPVTLDHGWGGPAWAWVDELRAEGERLLASFKDASSEIIEMTATKKYKRHSVEIYNDLEDKGPYLKAVSLLGALAPQVKGMEPIEFASFSENFPESDSATFEFDAPAEPTEPTSTEDPTEPDETPTEPVEEDSEEVPEETETPEDSAAGDDPAEFSSEELARRFSELQQTISTLQAQLNEASSAAEQFRDENEQIKFDQRKKEFTSFLNDLTGGGEPKLPPKAKSHALAMFAHLDGLKPKKKGEPTPLELFKDLLGALPVIDLGEHALKGEEPAEMSAQQWAKKAEDYVAAQAAKGTHVSFTEAVKHVKQTQTSS